MSDPFEDNLFSNGAAGSGIEVYEGSPLLIVPQMYRPKFFKDDKGDFKDVVDVTIIDFSSETPEMDDNVRIFAGRLVGALTKNARRNESGELNPKTDLPYMTVGILCKGPKTPGRNAPWILNPIEDKEIMSQMAAYARKNLKPTSPFDENE